MVSKREIYRNGWLVLARLMLLRAPEGIYLSSAVPGSNVLVRSVSEWETGRLIKSIDLQE